MDNLLKNIPVGLVLAMGLKCVALGVSGADAAIAVSLIGLLTLREYMEKHSKLKEVEERTDKKVSEMTTAIELQNKVIKAQAEEFSKLRDQMVSVKMAAGTKEQSISNLSKLGIK